MVTPRTRRRIARGVPLAVALGFTLQLLVSAYTGAAVPLGPWRVSYWLILPVGASLAFWLAWRFGDPRNAANRGAAWQLSYANPFRGLGKR